MLHVFGHIHEGRGIEVVKWNDDAKDNDSLVESVDKWTDPGIGNKQSKMDLTSRGGRPLDNSGLLTQQQRPSPTSGFPITELEQQPRSIAVLHSRQKGVMATGEAVYSGGDQDRKPSDIGLPLVPDVEDLERRATRRETAMINAAFCGPRGGIPKQFKPLVIDVELPIWGDSSFQKDAV